MILPYCVYFLSVNKECQLKFVALFCEQEFHCVSTHLNDSIHDCIIYFAAITVTSRSNLVDLNYLILKNKSPR